MNFDGPGELQIIHATEEQLAQLQQSHQIQILDSGHVPAELLQQLRRQNGEGETPVSVGSIDKPHLVEELDPHAEVSQGHTHTHEPCVFYQTFSRSCQLYGQSGKWDTVPTYSLMNPIHPTNGAGINFFPSLVIDNKSTSTRSGDSGHISR